MWELAGRQGFEPRYHGPEPCVLPLDDLPLPAGVRDRRETTIIANPNARQQGAWRWHWVTPNGSSRRRPSRCRRCCFRRSPAPAAPGRCPVRTRAPLWRVVPARLVLLSAMTRHAALATRFTGFLARPFVRRALLMRGLAPLACNLALFVSIHRCKSAVLCGHNILPSRTHLTSCCAHTQAATGMPRPIAQVQAN